jgi:hypothetical protein
MKIKVVVANFALITASALASLVLGEIVVRMILRPSDYLSVEMVRDEVLGAVPSTNTIAGGLDKWGFRNPDVPDTVGVVAIGDSHTYGNAATMADSWPYAFARLSGRSVYNMGLGGYGPNQYLQLLVTKALKLKPKLIIVGLYIGDDFENAFLITYGLEHWAHVRAFSPEQVDFDIWEKPSSESWHKQARIWLSRHSVIYQLVVHGPLLGRFQGELQIRNADRLSDSATTLSLPDKRILEAFRPKAMLRVLDQGNASVREGMRITFELLTKMNEISRQNHVDFLVVVIPTKEMVFEDYFRDNRKIHLGDVVAKLLVNEHLARERTFSFLKDSRIPYVDTLPALKRSVGQELYARTATDMHPNRNGYRVIAEAVFEALGRSQ